MALTRAQRVVALCFVMATFAWGVVFYGHSFYLESLTRAGRFTTSEMSGAIAFSFWCGIPAGIAVGRWLRSHTPHGVVVYGALAIAAGLVLLPQAAELTTLYFVFFLLGTGYPCLSASGITGTLNYYLNTHYARRLSWALTGASLGGMVVVPAMVWLRASYGFSTALLLIAATLVVALLIPSFALLREQARSTAVATSDAPVGSPVAEIVRSKKFLLLTFGGACLLGAQVGLLAHQIPMLRDQMSAEAAAIGVSITAGSAIPGRFLAGWLAERMSIALLSAAAAIFQGSGMLLLSASEGVTELYLACVLSGFVVGAIVMLPPLLIRDQFGARRYSEVYGYTNVGLYLGAGTGPAISGLLFDQFNGYAVALYVLAGMHAIGVLALLLGSAGAKKLGDHK